MNKSNQTSNILRQEGNDFYKKREFFLALLKYNQSLCYAESESENLGLAYANRSAVYFEMKLHDQCLKNIDLAEKNSYPKLNFEILNQRRAKCTELTTKKSQNVFKLSLPASRKLPFIANCLKIENNEKYGRHIITTADLSVGDIIAIDRSFCSIPISESQFVKVSELNIYQRCNNCLKSNQLNLIPCKSCCCAMFCSQECYEFAMKYFHQYECPVITDILKSGSVNMSLRIFFISLSLFGGNIKSLQRFYEETKKNMKNVFDFDHSTLINAEDVLIMKLKCLISLSKSSKKYQMMYQKSILSSLSSLNSIYTENIDFIHDYIEALCQISDHNFHGIFSSNLGNKTFDNSNLKSLQEPIGSGSFLFTSLINHSCTPNILRICVDGEMCLIVCRKIEKGSQIYDCYKNNFLMETREKRQNILNQHFNFRCDCEACLNDWPTLKELRVKDVKLMKYAKKINDELIESLNSSSKLANSFKKCKDILQENFKNYPSMELCIIQKSFATFLLKLAAQNISLVK
ncbi:SET and MYND domain-containing protein 4-like [Chironomus tepperi]|uniref:SET and MYND domain-containing protein 4-like n=1 Tax=Chironomus tepperi TaxID=113505 RepID=UPI00391FA5C2